MKKFLLILAFTLLFVPFYGQTVAVFYSSDDAQSILCAAIAKEKYPAAVITDVANLDSAGGRAAVDGLADSAYNRVVIAVDTSTLFSTGDMLGSWYDLLETVVLYQANDTLDGYVVDSVPLYLVAASDYTKPEVLWARTDMYSSKTQPLILKYLGTKYFSISTGAPTAITDSSITNSALSLTIDAEIGDYLYITAGTGIGQLRTVSDNTATVLYIGTDWTTNPTTGSTYVLKRALQSSNNYYDIYSNLYTLTYLSDLSSNVVLRNWKRLLNNDGKLNTAQNTAPGQDIDFLFNTVIPYGQIIFDYLSR